MNRIKEGREKIGWDKARLAANACLSETELSDIEEGKDSESLGLLTRILEQRGVRFEDERVIGPLSPESLREICLSADDLETLIEVSSDSGPYGIPIETGCYLRYKYLWTVGLVQKGSIREIVTFDGEDFCRHTARQCVRLTAKGRAWLEEHEIVW